LMISVWLKLQLFLFFSFFFFFPENPFKFFLLQAAQFLHWEGPPPPLKVKVKKINKNHWPKHTQTCLISFVYLKILLTSQDGVFMLQILKAKVNVAICMCMQSSSKKILSLSLIKVKINSYPTWAWKWIQKKINHFSAFEWALKGR
jgi:hypothetical protein